MKGSPGLFWRIVQFPVTRIFIAFLFVALAAFLVQMGMIGLGEGLGARGDAVWQLLSALVTLVVVYVAYWLYVRGVEKRALTEMAFQGMPRELGAGILFGALLFTVVIGILWLAGAYHVTGTNALSDILPVFALSMVSGLMEEILFRGILFRIIEEGLGSWLALILSGLIFGGLHLLNQNATVFSAAAIALEAGLLLGAAYMLTRRLWFAVGIHFAWNFTQGGIFGVNVSGNDFTGLLQSTSSGPEWLSGGGVRGRSIGGGGRGRAGGICFALLAGVQARACDCAVLDARHAGSGCDGIAPERLQMTTLRLLQILLAVLGILNVATGLALLLAPQWFFENLGNYPPFNRHYEGDLGAFITAVGIGLVWAARNPQKYRALIGIALISTTLHAVNHVYDDLFMAASFAQMMSGLAPVGLQLLLLALALYLASLHRRAPDELKTSRTF